MCMCIFYTCTVLLLSGRQFRAHVPGLQTLFEANIPSRHLFHGAACACVTHGEQRGYAPAAFVYEVMGIALLVKQALLALLCPRDTCRSKETACAGQLSKHNRTYRSQAFPLKYQKASPEGRRPVTDSSTLCALPGDNSIYRCGGHIEAPANDPKRRYLSPRARSLACIVSQRSAAEAVPGTGQKNREAPECAAHSQNLDLTARSAGLLHHTNILQPLLIR